MNIDDKLSSEKQELFIKCKFIIESLSEEAIHEANEDLERIIVFYKERQEYNPPARYKIPTVKCVVHPVNIRHPLVLDDL